MRHRSHLLGLFASLLVLLVGALPIAAQDATPEAAPATDLVVVANGLTSPRGFTWGDDGTMYVALAGSGGPNSATETAPTTDAIGPWTGGPTGAVVSIQTGCPVAVATGLPSAIDATGGILGADDVAILGGELYVSVDGGGAVHGNPDQPSGIYAVNADGSVVLVADLSAWVRANPVASVPPDYDPDAAGYRMVADEAGGQLWVLDPNSGQVISVTPDGTIARIADLSAQHPVPAAIVANPAGGVYLGYLTAVPFPDGAAAVVSVAADGTVADVWTGLTVVTGLAVEPDGTLLALQMSTGNLEEPPFLTPGSGQVVRQTGPDTSEVVAEGLMFPIALGIGPDGATYVALPALGAQGGEGVIVNLDAVAGTLDASPVAGTLVACEPIPETLSAPADEASPEAEASPVA